ncbi:hypothetical protein [Pseudonocardia sediminis]|nr:hypothetical protein [Pseudonocardia sediminis]
MRTSSPDLLRAAALGVASGARSTSGVAAAAWTSTPKDDGPARLLGTTAGRAVTAVALLGESGADKHPSVPSRLAPAGLGGRLVLGAAAAFVVALRDRRTPWPAVFVAVLGAGTSAWGGSRLRATASGQLGADLPGALTEDALAVLLAAYGARRPATT